MIFQLVFDNDGEPIGTFEDGVNWTIEAIAADLGVGVDDFSWDAATEEWEGDVRAVIGSMLTAALGEDWRELAASQQEGEE